MRFELYSQPSPDQVGLTHTLIIGSMFGVLYGHIINLRHEARDSGYTPKGIGLALNQSSLPLSDSIAQPPPQYPAKATLSWLGA